MGGVFCFCMIVKLCAVGPMSIFDEHYLLVFFVFLIIPYKYYHKCCYACMLFAREEGCRVFLFFFVHELKSQCWRRKTRWGVHSGGSKKEREPGMMCDAG